jgi:hypothetical protein
MKSPNVDDTLYHLANENRLVLHELANENHAMRRTIVALIRASGGCIAVRDVELASVTDADEVEVTKDNLTGHFIYEA